MADAEPDYGEEQYDALLRILVRVAGGAPLKAAASHENAKARRVLEIAMVDEGFARALLAAQNERAYWEGRDLLAALEGVQAAADQIAGSVDG